MARGLADARAPLRRRPYYGWLIVNTLGVTELISWGIVYYAFSVFLTPMQRELGWSQAEITGAFSLAMLVAGLAAFPAGRVLDRFGARGLMTAGSLAAALLVLAWSRVDGLVEFYLIWAGLGATMAAILYEPAFAAVTTWFQRQRQRALTVLTIYGGLASVVFIPLATALLGRYGWRTALAILAGLLAAITIPLHALVLRRRPQDHGLSVDGLDHAGPAEAQEPVTVEPAISVGAALRGSTLWWLAGAFALSTGASITINVHLLAYLSSQGYAAAIGATAAGLLGAAQIPSRLLIAMLGRRVSQRRLLVVLTLVQAAALLLLLAVPTTAGVLGFAALFGAGSGALTPTRAALLAEVYGAANYGSISGVIALITTLSRALVPLGASLLVAAAHGYAPLLWALVLAALGSAALVVGSRWSVAGGR